MTLGSVSREKLPQQMFFNVGYFWGKNQLKNNLQILAKWSSISSKKQ